MMITDRSLVVVGTEYLVLGIAVCMVKLPKFKLKQSNDFWDCLLPLPTAGFLLFVVRYCCLHGKPPVA